MDQPFLKVEKRDGAVEACRPHKPKVGGSNPPLVNNLSFLKVGFKTIQNYKQIEKSFDSIFFKRWIVSFTAITNFLHHIKKIKRKLQTNFITGWRRGSASDS